jgi:hypothetical protein
MLLTILCINRVCFIIDYSIRIGIILLNIAIPHIIIILHNKILHIPGRIERLTCTNYIEPVTRAPTENKRFR